MNQAQYPPLELLRRISAKYPNAWEQMEMFHRMNGTNGLPKWESWCYAPISAAIAVAMDGLEDSFDTRMNAITDAQAIAALAPWRQSKEVFIIDPDLQELLFGQDEELTINSEILLQIQYQCFYIQFAGIFDFLGYPCHGVFVHLEDDANANDKELRLLYLTGDGYTIGEPIHIDEGTLEESIAHTRMEAFNNVPDEHPEVRRRLMTGLENLAQESAAYKKTLQIILYLCAQNAEIAPDSEQAFITKRSSTGQIRDQYEEIRKWDVGFRIGAAVRKARSETAFRRLETEALRELGKRSGVILSTGGGCVTRSENYPLLHQNGTIFWLLRSPWKLPSDGRPLSQAESAEAMYARREPMYRRFADVKIDNEGAIERAVEAIARKVLL